ncbi:MAG: alpha/beta hydrolase [Hyphomicrobium sp.]
MSAKNHSYSVEGGRTGVLLIHGLCGTPTEMRYVANGLAREGYTVLCPTLAGHCGTADDLKATTWQDWLASAEAALDDLAGRCDQVIVGGLSTGALLALMLAARHPDKVSGLALYSPTLWLNGSKVPWTIKLARRFLAFPAAARHFDLPAPQDYGIKDARLREFIRKSMSAPGAAPVASSTPGLAALERRRLAKVVIGLLDRIHQPSLIIHPREDCLADLNNAFYLQKKLTGSAELLVLEDSYHLITVDRQRQTVVDATGRFLARLVTGLAPAQRRTHTAQPDYSVALNTAIA